MIQKRRRLFAVTEIDVENSIWRLRTSDLRVQPSATLGRSFGSDTRHGR